jgi:6-phosphofructokinase 1
VTRSQAHDRLALVGDPDRGDGRAVEPRDDVGQGPARGVPDVEGVVLDPPGPREVLEELALRDRDQRAVVVDGDGAHAGGPGVDGEDDGHSPECKPRVAARGAPDGQHEGMRIGMLTGGGDCPGLNAVIRAVVRKGEGIYGHELVGFRHGWRGVIEDETMELSIAGTRGLIHRGGTVLGTSRTNPFKADDGVARVLDTLAREHIDALVVIGGEDTLGVADQLAAHGVESVGVPKTIDNDLGATDFTFGFHTAVQIASDAIDRLHTTAESHDRVIIVEVMGRHAGWIAIYSGMAGGADIVLVPEEPFDIAEVCRRIAHRHQHGANFSIVVVAEGAQPKEGTMTLQSGEVDEFGHVRLGGISAVIQAEIEARTGFETRVTVLGHVLRGGTPTAYDRVLATRFGLAAIDAVDDGAFATMVALQGDAIVRVPLGEAVRDLKTVDAELIESASVFFG